MAFKRALWKSGLTYQQTCKSCRNVMTYTDEILDFRPWFPDGFVYCSRCKTPLRHNENLAINAPEVQGIFAQASDTAVDSSVAVPSQDMHAQSTQQQTGTALFCAQCGKAFNKDDRFCSGCGTKRP